MVGVRSGLLALVVDDEPRIRKLYQSLLTSKAITTIAASTNEGALTIVDANTNRQSQMDLIVADLIHRNATSAAPLRRCWEYPRSTNPSGGREFGRRSKIRVNRIASNVEAVQLGVDFGLEGEDAIVLIKAKMKTAEG
jgi:CheY-like chemotaxis protein